MMETIIVNCNSNSCSMLRHVEFGKLSQARAEAKAHVHHTGHEVNVRRIMDEWFEPEIGHD